MRKIIPKKANNYLQQILVMISVFLSDMSERGSTTTSTTKVVSEKDESMYDRYKLAQLGVDPEFLKFMNDDQAKELLKSLLYLIMKKQDGYA